MDEEKGEPSSPPKKISVREFVVRMSKPFTYTSETLGELAARTLTVKTAPTFKQRAPDVADLSDESLVRAYASSVSGYPSEDRERIPEPLSPEDAGQLTDADLLTFAAAYLDKVEDQEPSEDPIKQLAELIRRQRTESIEESKRFASLIAGDIARIGSSADLLKNYSGLSKSVSGLSSLGDQVRAVLGNSALASTQIGETLKAIQDEMALKTAASAVLASQSVRGPWESDAQKVASAHNDATGRYRAALGLGAHELASSVERERRLYESVFGSPAVRSFMQRQEDFLRLSRATGHLDLGPIGAGGHSAHNTDEIEEAAKSQDEEGEDLDVGDEDASGEELPNFDFASIPTMADLLRDRTADAVEAVQAAAERVEDAIGLVVNEVGQVSESVKSVLEAINREAKAGKRTAVGAARIAWLSLVFSVVAMLISAGSLWSDRKGAASNDRKMDELIQAVREQRAPQVRPAPIKAETATPPAKRTPATEPRRTPD